MTDSLINKWPRSGERSRILFMMHVDDISDVSYFIIHSPPCIRKKFTSPWCEINFPWSDFYLHFDEEEEKREAEFKF